MPARAAFLLIAVVTLAAHLAHSGSLWADDTLPLASAMQIWHSGFWNSKALYRDVWFDKPPLVSWIYLLWGATGGVPLRVAGAAYTFLCCVFAYLAARAKWSGREGVAAALFLAVFLTFGLPSAVLPLASDMLLLAPHLAAIALIWSGRPYLAGISAGIGFLASSKAAIVVAVCILWAWRGILPLLAGVATPIGVAAVWMLLQGSLAEGWRQAWKWGGVYAANTFVASPIREAIVRTANFAGFHSALLAGAISFFRMDLRPDKSEQRNWILWIALSLAGVALGLRFFPRYYFLLLPVLVLGAARGWVTGGRRLRVAMVALLLIPIVRFGPRYVTLAREGPANWSDLALDEDSKESARLLRILALDEPNLFVWGFRPEIFVYSHIPAATRFLESQPLSGVLADRHLFQSQPVAPEFTAPNVLELQKSRPMLIVDGLGPLNPELAIAKRADLARWFAAYKEVARTKFTIIYCRR